MVYSIGTPIVSTVVRTIQGDEVVTKQIAAEDVLTDLVLDNYPDDITIASATVKGFTLKSLQRPINHHAIFDGVPAYLREDGFDPTNHHFGIIEETAEIDEVLFEIAANEETGRPATTTKIPLHRIKAFTGGTDVETSGGSEDAGKGEGAGDTEEVGP